MAILKGIISKLNGSAGNLTFKQLGGPLALRAFQVQPAALFQKPEGGPDGSRGPEGVPGRA